MAYTVLELITDAYKLSSLVSREFEDVQGYQLLDGLKWLNQLIGDTASDYGAIPYITTYYEFNGVPGQEKYYLRNLLDIQSCVFFIQDIRYEMKFITRKKYFGLPRANNISALPLSYTYERAPRGVNLFCYFYPQEPYVIQIVGNMYLNATNMNQDLEIATANLGVPTLTQQDSFTLYEHQLVVNGVDLQGTYDELRASSDPNAAVLRTALESFVNYINTGIQDGTGSTPVIPQVTASIDGEEFILSGAYAPSIQIKTLGQIFSTADALITESGDPIVTESGDPIIDETSIGQINFSNFPMNQGLFINTYYAWDTFYADFYMYQLADRICQMNDFVTPEHVTNQLNIYRQRLLKDAEAIDLAAEKISILGRAVGINYAQANIGRGFTTSGY